jgi:hypothetical protein
LQADLFTVSGGVIDPVKIPLVFGHDRAELFEIEISVPGLDRFERPLDEFHAEFERSLTLGPFQTPPDPGALIFLPHARHMRIKGFLATQKGRNAQNIARQPIAVIRPERESACVASNDEVSNRRKLDLGQSKDFPLKINAFRKFVQGRTFPNFYRIFHIFSIVDCSNFRRFAKVLSNWLPVQIFCYFCRFTFDIIGLAADVAPRLIFSCIATNDRTKHARTTRKTVCKPIRGAAGRDRAGKIQWFVARQQRQPEIDHLLPRRTDRLRRIKLKRTPALQPASQKETHRHKGHLAASAFC